MKPALVLLCLIIASQKVKAQTDPVADSVFDYMIIRDVTFAITGDEIPTSGIKLDISKPEATIAATYPVGRSSPFLFTMEFKGGVTDKNFQFVRGFKNTNTSFDFRPSLHWVLPCGSALYGDLVHATPAKMILRAKNRQIINKSTATRDSFFVISRLRNRHLAGIGVEADSTVNTISAEGVADSIALYYFRTLLGGQDVQSLPNLTYANVLSRVRPVQQQNGDLVDASYYSKLIAEYERLQARIIDLPKNEVAEIIKNASTIWTKKTYNWLSLSPYIRAEKVNEYLTKIDGRDSLYFKPRYNNLYGVGLTYNIYSLWPQSKVGILVRGSVSLAKESNLATLSSYVYTTRTPQPTTVGLTERVETGNAYEAGKVKDGRLFQARVDAYGFWLKPLFPGLYGSLTYGNSTLYNLTDIKDRQTDKELLGLEGGLLFNINNRDKDKSLLSLLIYIRHEDLTDKLRTNAFNLKEETLEDFRKRNISIGLRVGLPITLPVGK